MLIITHFSTFDGDSFSYNGKNKLSYIYVL